MLPPRLSLRVDDDTEDTRDFAEEVEDDAEAIRDLSESICCRACRRALLKPGLVFNVCRDDDDDDDEEEEPRILLLPSVLSASANGNVYLRLVPAHAYISEEHTGVYALRTPVLTPLSSSTRE